MSDRDDYKVLEQISGTGTVAGAGLSEPCRVRYEIVIRQEMIATAADSPRTPGLKSVGGKIWSGDDPFLAATHLSSDLTLNMADGRVWDFIFTHRSGESTSRGGRVPEMSH